MNNVEDYESILISPISDPDYHKLVLNLSQDGIIVAIKRSKIQEIVYILTLKDNTDTVKEVIEALNVQHKLLSVLPGVGGESVNSLGIDVTELIDAVKANMEKKQPVRRIH